MVEGAPLVTKRPATPVGKTRPTGDYCVLEFPVLWPPAVRWGPELRKLQNADTLVERVFPTGVASLLVTRGAPLHHALCPPPETAAGRVVCGRSACFLLWAQMMLLRGPARQVSSGGPPLRVSEPGGAAPPGRLRPAAPPASANSQRRLFVFAVFGKYERPTREMLGAAFSSATFAFQRGATRFLTCPGRRDLRI